MRQAELYYPRNQQLIPTKSVQKAKHRYLAPHRVFAAFFAMAFRFRDDSFFALALPPFSPPNRPSATAAGFLPSFGSGSCPVD
jgi:hypothetical protein